MSEAVKLVSNYLLGISEMFAGAYESNNPEFIKEKQKILEEQNSGFKEDCKNLKSDMQNVGSDMGLAFDEYISSK